MTEWWLLDANLNVVVESLDIPTYTPPKGYRPIDYPWSTFLAPRRHNIMAPEVANYPLGGQDSTVTHCTNLN